MTREPVYLGKTKEVFARGKGELIFRYRDTVLGRDGKIDPGADSILLELPGKGVKAAAAAEGFFLLLREAGLPTHFRRRLSADEILYRRAERFPLEVVVRNYAWGSYLRRYGSTPALLPLGGLIECFHKCDAAEDPCISFPQAVAAGLIPPERVEDVRDLARRVNEVLCGRFEILDFKVEFGVIAGETVLIDELSADSLRLLHEGRVLDYPETLDYLSRAFA